MGIITIVGAGMMGSAMSFPAYDNEHEVRLVGTPLDREIIASVQETGFHPTLQRTLPYAVEAFQIEQLEQALKGCDLVLGGVSSFGVEWFTGNVLPFVPDGVPVLSVTKGLENRPDGTLVPFPHSMQHASPHERQLSLNAIGGPCISFELADRRQTSVVFCGDDGNVLSKLKHMLTTSYYRVSLSTDVVGVECAVALKNAYALGVSLAIGLEEARAGIGCSESYNPQAALFGQSVREIGNIVKMQGGNDESLVFGVADLYVTVFGGRTRKLGILLGRGMSFEDALKELENATLESVVTVTRVTEALRSAAAAGKINIDDFPLLVHIDEILNNNEPVAIPWEDFELDTK